MMEGCGRLILVCSLVLLVQDLASSRATRQHENDHDNQSRLTQILADTERRLLKHMEDKIQEVNQTREMAHLEKLYFIVYEELELAKDQEKVQGTDIERLESTVLQQEEELRNIRGTVDELRETVATLTGGFKQMRTANGDTPRSMTPSMPTTTHTAMPVDLNSIHPSDCHDMYQTGGAKYPGDYYIMIQPYLAMEPFKVCCKVANNTGWTIIQRRRDGSVSFYRTWKEYKHGFGNLEGEFWLGNQHIYQLTNQRDYGLRIEMTDWEGHNYYAEYNHFRIASESDKYRLHVHGYHGNAGDSLTSHWENHDGQPFSTKDQDNDERFYDNCADHFRGAWWFKSCFESHLNGVYYHKGSHSNYFVRNGIQWNGIHLHSSLKAVSMMIKPTENFQENSAAEGLQRLPNGIH